MATEFALGDDILVLDGRVMELFHRGSDSTQRYHVEFMRVNVVPHGEDFKVRLGLAYGEDDIHGGRRWKLTAEEFARFRAFIALATAARDNGPTVA